MGKSGETTSLQTSVIKFDEVCQAPENTADGNYMEL